MHRRSMSALMKVLGLCVGGSRRRLVHGARARQRPRDRSRRHRRHGRSGRTARRPASGSSPKPATSACATSRASSPTTRGASSCPICPPREYDVWARGYGLVDSAKTKARPARTSASPRSPRRTEAEAAKYYPAIYWYSMLKIPAADQFGAHAGIGKNVTQTRWLDAMKNNGCIGCHQLGQQSTRTIPAEFGTFPIVGGRLAAARAVGSGRADDARPADQPRPAGVRALRRLDGSHREGRAAACQAAAAPGRRAQHRRHAARLDEREAVPARSDRQRSPLSDRQCERSALRVAGIQLRRHCRSSIR